MPITVSSPPFDTAAPNTFSAEQTFTAGAVFSWPPGITIGTAQLDGYEGAGTLRVNGSGLYVTTTLVSRGTTDLQGNVSLLTGVSLTWAADTNLYRSAADTLKTDDVFIAGGKLKWGAAGDEQTTVGAAGGASALPATPTKYLKVIDSAGTTLVIPAYAAA